jgi:glycosyltransferase involved in cell wall biosynthesis
MRLFLSIPYNSITGYGQCGLGLAKYLARAGHDVRLDPSHVATPLPQESANLLTLPPSGPFDHAIQMNPPQLLAPRALGKQLKGRHIGWSMWESTLIRCEDHELIPYQTEAFSDLLMTDTIGARALEELTHRHVGSLQMGFDPEPWEAPEDRDWNNGPFRFIMIGMLTQRKGPFLAIKAFEKCRKLLADMGNDRPTELHLKTNARALHPAIEDRYEGVHVHYAHWSHKQLHEFMSKSHAYLAPSRGEGTNLPALQAMSMGLAVAATDWGGHSTWLNPEVSFPIPLEASEPSPLGGDWAAPDTDALAKWMAGIVAKPAIARRMGTKAIPYIKNAMGWETAVRRLEEQQLR